MTLSNTDAIIKIEPSWKAQTDQWSATNHMVKVLYCRLCGARAVSLRWEKAFFQFFTERFSVCAKCAAALTESGGARRRRD